MIKNAFIESLKIVDGRFIHPELHWQRITDTQRVHFGNSSFLYPPNQYRQTSVSVP